MREKIVELLMDMPFGNSTEEAEERHASDTADYLIDNDVVPVVRCKDCKWCYGKDDFPYCKHPTGGMSYVQLDDFCSYGERREGE